ncbi:O-antigen ligase family protein [Phenylobacterium soli]|uniref:O-antigen ligase-related domain-containing protein n=1 Tax=Phenylobacterium soli TaxID=2170551 RepID=A0A328ALH4_9CAUL|nr:O-antigen ligase family protein [Phenylobacterium soli]RAK55772.1 hypothetical protein DJ017_15260 [Phenylobacterium soli]
MTEAQAVGARGVSLSRWCGWVVVGGLALTPLLGWLGPMGFAVLVGLMGLLCLPALRIADEDRPQAVVLLTALVWAAMSTAWSPYHPSKPGNNTALKLAFELPLFWSAMCAARAADPRLRTLALKVLAWGTALFGVLLLAEVVADARIFETLHLKFYGPIRHDISQTKVAHSAFVLALLTPLAFAAALRARVTPWVVLPMAAGAILAGLRFKGEAPALAIFLAVIVGLASWRWPKGGPRALAAGAVVYWLAAPLVILGVRAAGLYETLQHRVELSWSMRMDYWRHAVDWTLDHPIRGWGLDASRMFSPGIVLHPHDDALQVWLELGGVGAVLAAAFFALTLNRLAREEADAPTAGVVAACTVYLLFGALNFGVWQEWWLALGGLAAVGAALLRGPAPS